jgi:NADH-quinone oxidoreductase subunit L
VILAMHHEQDIEKMGGLRRRIWQTHAVFLVAVLAISGVPPLSGFFSKDEVLLSAFASQVPGARTLYEIAVATAALTAFYMFRLYFKTFSGESRAPAELRDHIAESAPVMVNPLWVLAVLSAMAGFAGLPQVWGDMLGIENSNSLENFVAPALAHAERVAVDPATEYGLTLLAIGAAGLGILLAWLLYERAPGVPARIAASFSGLYGLLVNKYYVDEIYDALFVRPLVALSQRVLFRGVDQGLVDGALVNGSARAVRALAADGLKYLQSGLAQSYIFLMIVGTAAIVGYLLR